MPVAGRVLLVLAVAGAATATARAQEGSPSVAAGPPAASGQPRGRLVLTIGGLREFQDTPTEDTNSREKRAASVDTLFWGDLRGVLEAEQSNRMPLDLRADFRLRLTPDDPWDGILREQGVTVTTARGYQGGREYQLRELYAGTRIGESNHLLVGRQIILDADATTIDGLRFQHRFGPALQAEVFGGLFPNPFSRSLENDYLSTDQLAFAGGLDVAYRLAEAHGALAVAAESFLGNDAGNGVAGTAPNWSNQVLGVSQEEPRLFLFWRDYWRPHPAVDVYSYLVLDVDSEAGTQVTNGHLALNWRPLKALRFELSYSHMSTLAAEMYLKHFLFREPTPMMYNQLLNNLLILRMAQDEARLLADASFGNGRFVAYWIGRYLRRSLLEALDPRFRNDKPDAYDLTVGLRDTRSVAGLRLGLEVNALFNYRSEVQTVSADVQREFARGIGTFDLQLAFQKWRDDNYGAICASDNGMPPSQSGPSMNDPNTYTQCFGFTDGTAIDVGGLVGLALGPSWFALLDAHLILNSSTSPAQVSTTPMFNAPALDGPAIATVLGFLRLQYRF